MQLLAELNRETNYLLFFKFIRLFKQLVLFIKLIILFIICIVVFFLILTKKTREIKNFYLSNFTHIHNFVQKVFCMSVFF